MCMWNFWLDSQMSCEDNETFHKAKVIFCMGLVNKASRVVQGIHCQSRVQYYNIGWMKTSTHANYLFFLLDKGTWRHTVKKKKTWAWRGDWQKTTLRTLHELHGGQKKKQTRRRTTDDFFFPSAIMRCVGWVQNLILETLCPQSTGGEGTRYTNIMLISLVLDTNQRRERRSQYFHHFPYAKSLCASHRRNIGDLWDLS